MSPVLSCARMTPCMRSPVLVADAARTPAAKLLAALLAVLAVSPLTDPFATFDLADLFATAVSASGSISTTKGTENAAYILTVVSAMVLFAAVSEVRRPTVRSVAARDVRSSVLRI